MTQPTLESLITAFLQASADEERAVWEKADCARAIADHFGPTGLDALRRRSGLSRDRLTELARVAAAFPPGHRWPLSVAHHLTALSARHVFPAGTPEHDPSFWLDRAQAQHWSRDQLAARLRRAVSRRAPRTERQQVIQRRFQAAARRFRQLSRDAAAFNAHHAAYWASYALVVEVPVEEDLTAEELCARATEALAAQLPQVRLVAAPQLV